MAHKQDVFDPLHYLLLLEQRPYALEYAKPLRQWQKDWEDELPSLVTPFA